MTEEAPTRTPAPTAAPASPAKPGPVRQRPAEAAGQSAAAPSPAAPPAAAPMPTRQDSDVSEDAPPETFVRRPFGAAEMKLSAPQRANFHRHWFNDTPGRIDRAKEAGYAHVNDDRGAPMKRVVGTSQFGGPLTAYLMEIPLAWYKADMAAEQKKVDEIDEALRGDKIGRKDDDQRYTPKDAIRMTTAG